MWVGGKGERDGYFGRTRSGGLRGRGRVNDKGGREGFHHHLRPSLCAKLQREGQSCGELRDRPAASPPRFGRAPLQPRPTVSPPRCRCVQLGPRPAATPPRCRSAPLPLRPEAPSWGRDQLRLRPAAAAPRCAQLGPRPAAIPLRCRSAPLPPRPAAAAPPRCGSSCESCFAGCSGGCWNKSRRRGYRCLGPAEGFGAFGCRTGTSATSFRILVWPSLLGT